jgi:predicted RNase H-like HicB family nuclease
MKLTLVISKGEEFYIGTIKEIPAVITQGKTIDEARENVMDALALYLENMKETNKLENTVLEEDLMLAQ